MERAAAQEKARKAEAAEASRKRAAAATPATDAPDLKRPKLEHESASAAVPAVAAPSASTFNFSSLPATLVTDLIVANLQAFTEPALLGLVQVHRHKKAGGAAAVPIASATPPPSAPAGPSRAPFLATATPPPTGPRGSIPPSEPRADRKLKSATPPPPAPVPPPAVVKEEPVDPLKMDIDDEEIEYEPDKLNLEVRDIVRRIPSAIKRHRQMSGDAEPVDEAEAALDHDMDAAEVPLTEFKLPTPRELEADERDEIVRKAIARIREGAKELASHEPVVEAGDALRSSPGEMWMLLLVRMVTRVSDPSVSTPEGQEEQEDAKDEEGALVRRSEIYERQDRLRHALCDYIMADFPGRYVEGADKGDVVAHRLAGYDWRLPG